MANTEQFNPSANDKGGVEGRNGATPTELSERLAHGDPNSPSKAMMQKGERRPSGEHQGGVLGTTGHTGEGNEESEGEDAGSQSDDDSR